MSMKRLMILFLAVASNGCVYSAMPTPVCPEYPETALILDVPQPIPDSVYINISPGQPAKANEGGKALLRNYVNLRQRIQQWRESQP